MARRLMNLRDVPDEEADAVRSMLDELGVDWYELPPTAFGLSAGSLWIREDSEFPRAKDAFDRFQFEYSERARRAASGDERRVEPMRLLLAAIISAVILAFFFWPILQLSPG